MEKGQNPITLEDISKGEFISLKRFMSDGGYDELSDNVRSDSYLYGDSLIELSIRLGYDEKRKVVRFFALKSGRRVPLEDLGERYNHFKIKIDEIIADMKNFLNRSRDSNRYEH